MNAPPARASVSRPLFLNLNGRRLFALLISPNGPCTGAMLYLPPFAEEMNRCRSHAVAQARSFAALGIQCLLLDPYGCGESDGSIIDAEWRIWLDDGIAAAQWLAAETGHTVNLWGVRTGALLAAEIASSGLAKTGKLLFWQAVLDGKLFLNQYLRLRIASQMVNEAADRETTEGIRARLSAGEIIEIAGYPLAGSMADSLAERRMADLKGLERHPILWIEIVSKPGQPVSVPSRRFIEDFEAVGGRVTVEAITCPMIWQLHERADAPELRNTTLHMVGECQ